MSKAIYSMITQRILEKLRHGTVPWRMPWSAGGLQPANLVSRKPYRGINSLILGMSGYNAPWWLSRKQIHKLGGHIRKGERCTPVLFWLWPDREDEENEETKKTGAFCRYYRVWNLEQTEAVKAPVEETATKEFCAIAACENVVQGYPSPPRIEIGSHRAFYRPDEDQVCVPDPKRFEPEEEYYSTLFHELVHSTGHQKRLARPELMRSHSFGSADYSREELTAEIGAAFLCSQAGIAPATLDNSVGYIGSWYKRLSQDPGLIVSASQRAQKAADWILGTYHNHSPDAKEPGC